MTKNLAQYSHMNKPQNHQKLLPNDFNYSLVDYSTKYKVNDDDDKA